MTAKEFDFSKSIKELEAITAWFESEEVDLDMALEKFERGMTLATELKQHLADVEVRIEKVKQKFDGKTDPVPPATESEPNLFQG